MNAFNYKGSHERLGVSSEGRLIGTASGKDYTKQIAEALLEEQKPEVTAEEIGNALGAIQDSAWPYKWSNGQVEVKEEKPHDWRADTIELQREKNKLVVRIADIETELKRRDSK